jgi:endonuclease/exonuclease/phosphatase family metal-dependent hydrolase
MPSFGLKRAAAGGRWQARSTFPSLMPVFALDRFYLRGLRCRSTMVPRLATTGCAWARMSDHLPLVVPIHGRRQPWRPIRRPM